MNENFVPRRSMSACSSAKSSLLHQKIHEEMNRFKDRSPRRGRVIIDLQHKRSASASSSVTPSLIALPGVRDEALHKPNSGVAFRYSSPRIALPTAKHADPLSYYVGGMASETPRGNVGYSFHSKAERFTVKLASTTQAPRDESYGSIAHEQSRCSNTGVGFRMTSDRLGSGRMSTQPILTKPFNHVKTKPTWQRDVKRAVRKETNSASMFRSLSAKIEHDEMAKLFRKNDGEVDSKLDELGYVGGDQKTIRAYLKGNSMASSSLFADLRRRLRREVLQRMGTSPFNELVKELLTFGFTEKESGELAGTLTAK